MVALLWILAVMLFVTGIYEVCSRRFLLGAVLMIVGILLGPVSVSLFI